MTIDQKVDMWMDAVLNKNFTVSDALRNELEQKGVFCVTSIDGPIAYHTKFKSRNEFEADMRKNINAEKRFDAYLESIKSSSDYKRLNC